MSFQLHMFQFEKRTNSTLRPQEEGDLFNCNLNTPTDLMEPVFRLEDKTPNPNIDYLALYAYNYIYVEDWGRYYWIDKWVWNNGFWDAHCHIDPLASWRNEIGECDEYVLRSAKSFDPNVVDNLYPLDSRCLVEQSYTSWNIPKDPEGCYVIGIVGGNGLVEYYYINDLPLFGAYMFGDTLWNNVVADDPGVIGGNIPTFMRAQFNPLQYVVSCMWYPFDVPHEADVSSIKFGYFSSGLYSPKVKRESFSLFRDTLQLLDHPQAADRGTYLQLAPYTRLRLSALPWGEVDLDTTKFANQTEIVLQAWVDPITGSSKLYVANEYSDVILTLVGQIGVTEQLSQVLKDNLATVTGAASAAAGLIGGILGGPAALAGGIATAISGIGSAAAAQYPDVSSTGTNGARIAVTPTQIRLTQTFQWVVGDDPENRGRPLCQRVNKLKELRGYIMVADPDVPLPATQEEIDKIKEYMANGFFYE